MKHFAKIPQYSHGQVKNILEDRVIFTHKDIRAYMAYNEFVFKHLNVVPLHKML